MLGPSDSSPVCGGDGVDRAATHRSQHQQRFLNGEIYAGGLLKRSAQVRALPLTELEHDIELFRQAIGLHRKRLDALPPNAPDREAARTTIERLGIELTKLLDERDRVQGGDASR